MNLNKSAYASSSFIGSVPIMELTSAQKIYLHYGITLDMILRVCQRVYPDKSPKDITYSLIKDIVEALLIFAHPDVYRQKMLTGKGMRPETEKCYKFLRSSASPLSHLRRQVVKEEPKPEPTTELFTLDRDGHDRVTRTQLAERVGTTSAQVNIKLTALGVQYEIIRGSKRRQTFYVLSDKYKQYRSNYSTTYTDDFTIEGACAMYKLLKNEN